MRLEDVVALMARASTAGRVGAARKTRPVDARPARPGEVVVTLIRGEGVETRSRPAREGDWVVRNRCEETGNEEYLVSAATFAERYRCSPPTGDAAGWRECHPRGKTVRFLILEPEEAPFRFRAPWGEEMVARAGDALVQDPDREDDVYRVAKASFTCTYQVTTPPGRAR